MNKDTAHTALRVRCSVYALLPPALCWGALRALASLLGRPLGQLVREPYGILGSLVLSLALTLAAAAVMDRRLKARLREHLARSGQGGRWRRVEQGMGWSLADLAPRSASLRERQEAAESSARLRTLLQELAGSRHPALRETARTLRAWRRTHIWLLAWVLGQTWALLILFLAG